MGHLPKINVGIQIPNGYVLSNCRAQKLQLKIAKKKKEFAKHSRQEALARQWPKISELFAKRPISVD